MDPRRRSRVIPIEWLSLDELEARLKAYSPIGMFLCTSLQGQCDVDPASLIDRPHEDDVEDGLGVFQTWAGLVDGIPFAIRSILLERLGAAAPGYGFAVRFPAFLDSDRAMFDLVPELPVPVPRLDAVWIETLRPGKFGVARGAAPIYTSTSHGDALAAVQLLERWHPGAFAVVDAEESLEWLVIGPTSGRFIAQGWKVLDEATARRLAASYSAKRGAVFTARPCSDQ